MPLPQNTPNLPTQTPHPVARDTTPPRPPHPDRTHHRLHDTQPHRMSREGHGEATAATNTTPAAIPNLRQNPNPAPNTPAATPCGLMDIPVQSPTQTTRPTATPPATPGLHLWTTGAVEGGATRAGPGALAWLLIEGRTATPPSAAEQRGAIASGARFYDQTTGIHVVNHAAIRDGLQAARHYRPGTPLTVHHCSQSVAAWLQAWISAPGTHRERLANTASPSPRADPSEKYECTSTETPMDRHDRPYIRPIP